MDFIVGGLGFLIGLFLWSSIFGSIFGTIPLEQKLVKAGLLVKVRWGRIIGTILFAATILILTAIFAKTFFYGSLVGGVCMLFNIGKLRAEAVDNFSQEQARVDENGAR